MNKLIFSIFLLLCNTAYGEYTNNRDAEKDATQAIITAAYKQSGIEENVTKYIEQKILPKEHKELLGRVTIIVRTVITQRAEARWEF